MTELRFKPGCAPSVLNTFINMMLFQHSKIEDGCYEYMFEGQETMQMCFVLIALLCIPVMLFGKPLCTLLCSKPKSLGDGKVIVSILNIGNFNCLR